MSNIPSDLIYAKSHEWIRVSGDTATVGITDHAQAELTDIVFVELPAVGRQVKAGEACAVVESVKTASDIYSPVSGEIVDVNAALLAIDAVAIWDSNLAPLPVGWAGDKLDGSPHNGNQMVKKCGDNPGLVNSEPFGGGWFYKIKLSNAAELNALLSPEDYRQQIGG